MMPDYTLEQKAKAFDLLWNNCGNIRAEFQKYSSHFDSSYELNPRNTAIIRRIPQYTFTLWYSGNVSTFRDVLHNSIIN